MTNSEPDYLDQLVDVGIALSATRDFKKLLTMILSEARRPKKARKSFQRAVDAPDLPSWGPSRSVPASTKMADSVISRSQKSVTMWGLVGVLALAAALRFVDLNRSPPGIHPDEAANAWNAYSLAKTGRDWSGERWPAFYIRAFGENRPPLYVYSLLPLELVLPPTAVTARIPAAGAGVLTVLLLFLVGRRAFGTRVGLAGAALLAVNPWHLWLSRLALSASLSPLLILLVLWSLMRAGFPLTDAAEESVAPSVPLALLAGVVTGSSFYGYWGLRLFLPIALAVLVAVNWRRWWNLGSSRPGRWAVAAWAGGLVLTLGPLAWQHALDPDLLERARQTALWTADDPWALRLRLVLARYPAHFGPDFLFLRGDTFWPHTLPTGGQFHWYALPLLVAGGVAALGKLRRSASARLLTALLLVYPVSDCFARHDGPHALRSASGICFLALLAGLGAGALLDPARAMLGSRFRQWLTPVALTALLIWAGVENARYWKAFFGDYNHKAEIYEPFHADLLEASKWIRDRLDRYDSIFVTTRNTTEPFAVTLVGLQYDPHRWFREPREFARADGFDVCTRYGKLHFLYTDRQRNLVNELERNGTSDRVLFVVRPGEMSLQDPVHEIRNGDHVVLQLYERLL